MQPILTIQEIYFLIAFNESFNPRLITPEFLHSSVIVPEDWELARSPQLQHHLSEISFTNGGSITACPNSLEFRQIIRADLKDSLPILEVAQKFVRVLKNVPYKSVSINPRSFFTFNVEDETVARRYITSKFMSCGPWQTIGDSYPETTLELNFTLNDRPFSITIADVCIQISTRSPQPALLFSGEFHNEIVGQTAIERIRCLCEILSHWKEDFQTYRQILQEYFIPNADIAHKTS